MVEFVAERADLQDLLGPETEGSSAKLGKTLAKMKKQMALEINSIAQLHSKDLKAKEKKILKLKSKNEALGRANMDLQSEMHNLKTQKKKALKPKKKGRREE